MSTERFTETIAKLRAYSVGEAEDLEAAFQMAQQDRDAAAMAEFAHDAGHVLTNYVHREELGRARKLAGSLLALRRWGQAHGFGVPERGPLPHEVVDAFLAEDAQE